MRIQIKTLFAGCVLATLFSSGCISVNGQSAATKAGKWAGKWEVLFDGNSTDHWRGFKQHEFPNKSWKVENSALKTIPGETGADLVTKEQYDNFELELEWRISPGGNSGIMYHVTENFVEPWHTGPEMQVLDDDKHADGKDPKTSAPSTPPKQRESHEKSIN
jgi:hypothetical protein